MYAPIKAEYYRKSTCGEDYKGFFDANCENAKSYTQYWQDYIKRKILGIWKNQVQGDIVKSETNDKPNPHSHTKKSSFGEISEYISNKETANYGKDHDNREDLIRHSRYKNDSLLNS